MDAREAAGQVGGDDASTTRMGAVALPIGVVLIAISEIFHPSREDPMDFPPSSGSMPKATSGPPSTSASTLASSFCLVAWSPSTTR